MYRVGIKQNFEAYHFLMGDFGDEARPHSHLYTAHWIMDVMTLDADGFSMDIALMEELLEVTTGELRGVLLNDLPFFSGKQPSVENTAHYLSLELFRKIRSLPCSTSFLHDGTAEPVGWGNYASSSSGLDVANLNIPEPR